MILDASADNKDTGLGAEILVLPPPAFTGVGLFVCLAGQCGR